MPRPDPLAAHGHDAHWQRAAMMAKLLEDASARLRSPLIETIAEAQHPLLAAVQAHLKSRRIPL